MFVLAALLRPDTRAFVVSLFPLTSLSYYCIIRPMTYHFYILLSKRDGNYYYGHTSNLRERLRKHREGLTRSTKSRRPLELVYFEPSATRKESLCRERQFKNGRIRKETRDKLIRSFPPSKLIPFNS